MSLLAEMNQKALNLGLPISVHLDITYRCNERCVHCYLDHDDHGEMTTAEITDVLEQLSDAGVFFLSLSGGEVLLRRDFFEIVERARKLLFNVKVKTNGVMIGAKEAARLRQLGVEQIQISVYSHRPKVHDAITKLPGSLNKTIRAIRFLKSQGLKVTIANVLMAGNFSDQPGVIALARELELRIRSIRRLLPKWMGTHPPSPCALRRLSSSKFSITRNSWATWKSSALLRRRPAMTSWTASRAAQATPPAISLLTAMFFPACSSLFPAAMCGGRNSSISGTIPRS
jgi:MoaA/NifB/PqqE/SkfB family radical SAM enzyme